MTKNLTQQINLQLLKPQFLFVIIISIIIVRSFLLSLVPITELIPNFLLAFIITFAFLKNNYDYWFIALISLIHESFFYNDPTLNLIFILICYFIARNFPIFTRYSDEFNHFLLSIGAIAIFYILKIIEFRDFEILISIFINYIVTILFFPISYKLVFYINEKSNARQ